MVPLRDRRHHQAVEVAHDGCERFALRRRGFRERVEELARLHLRQHRRFSHGVEVARDPIDGFVAGLAKVVDIVGPIGGLRRRSSVGRAGWFAHRRVLDFTEDLDYYPRSMHASRFSFAFTYRYYFASSGEADGVLTMQ